MSTRINTTPRLSTVVLTIALLAVPLIAGAQLLTTLYDINQGSVPIGTQVRLEGVVVTAVAYNGFYVQDTAGGPFCGAWAYTGSAEPPDASLAGQIINLEGNYDEYYDLTEILASSANGGVIEIVDAGDNMPLPALVTAEEANTAHPAEAEKWECVLIRVLNLQTTEHLGYGEWLAQEIAPGAELDILRLDDQFGVEAPPIGTEMTSVTGVLNYNFSDFKLEPRSIDDILFGPPVPTASSSWGMVKSLY